MASSDSVTRWFEGVKSGDDEAARRIWERYSRAVKAIASRRISSAARASADEEDMVQSVFCDLFSGAARGKFAGVSTRAELWGLLLTITYRKLVNQHRTAARRKRAGTVVRERDASSRERGRPFRLDQLCGETPSPEFLASLREEHERLLAQLRDESVREVALLKMDGYGNAEIADRLGVSIRSVERKLKLIREQWRKEILA